MVFSYFISTYSKSDIEKIKIKLHKLFFYALNPINYVILFKEIRESASETAVTATNMEAHRLFIDISYNFYYTYILPINVFRYFHYLNFALLLYN